MKLRTQLILAFLLLAVVPLTGLTVYYYLSSIETFRRVVEAESSALAGEMGGRMQLVTGDLNRRIERLGGLPFLDLLASNEESADPEASQLFASLIKEMGEAAVYVDSVEFKPMRSESIGGRASLQARSAKAPAPPDVPPPPRVASAGSILIYMHGNEQGAESPIPRETAVSGLPMPDSADLQVTIEKSESDRWVVRRRPRLLKPSGESFQSTERHLQHLQRAAEDVGRRTAEAIEAAAQGEQSVASQLRLLGEKAARSAARQERMKILLNQEFQCEVQDAGKTIGMLSAQVNAREVLHSVLQKTRRARGEIPFAVDADGILYSPDSEHIEELDKLEISAAGMAPGSGLMRGVPRDWVVATRQEPLYGLTFGIARPIGESIQEIRNTAVRNLGFGIAVIGIALLGILPLSSRMTRNLASLTRGAERLAQGDLTAQVPVRSSDEFGQLATTFNRMARDLKKHQASLLVQERMRKELEMCRQIQEEMLPRSPLRLPFAEIRGLSIAAREVGGDFFNYFTLADNKVAILIGDVSGKGVPAALLMANLQATLRARLPLENDLAKLATDLDLEIHDQTPPEAYLTLFMAVLDPATKILTWVNAGHDTQFALQTGGGLQRLSSTGRPLGLLPGGGYVTRQLELGEGDALFLYTDGLVDCVNRRDEVFGLERLESVVTEGWAADSDTILTRVETATLQHRQGHEAADDATMMVLRIGVFMSSDGDSQNEPPKKR